MTNKKSTPRLDWITFVATQSAKSRIRQWYKKHYREEHEEQGRKLLEAEFTRAGADEIIKSGKLQKIAEELNYPDISDLLVAIGYGEVNLPRITNRLKQEQQPEAPTQQDPLLHSFARRKERPSAPGKEIQGLEGMMYQNAKCCNPLPGEGIIGVVTRSRGVMIHRDDCPNLEHANPNRRMYVSWEGEQQVKHAVKLEIHTIDRVGVLKDILTKIADYNTNISNTKVKIQPDHTAHIEITLDVESLKHLDRVKEAISQVNDVISVRRISGHLKSKNGF